MGHDWEGRSAAGIVPACLLFSLFFAYGAILLLPQIKLPRELHHAALSSGNPDLLRNAPSETLGRADAYLAKTLSAIRANRVPDEINPTNPYTTVPMWQYVPPRHVGEKRRYTDAEYAYDPDTAGGFPPRAATLDREYAWVENEPALYDEHPLAWVPEPQDDEQVQSIHYLQSEHNPIKQV